MRLAAERAAAASVRLVASVASGFALAFQPWKLLFGVGRRLPVCALRNGPLSHVPISADKWQIARAGAQ